MIIRAADIFIVSHIHIRFDDYLTEFNEKICFFLSLARVQNERTRLNIRNDNIIVNLWNTCKRSSSRIFLVYKAGCWFRLIIYRITRIFYDTKVSDYLR